MALPADRTVIPLPPTTRRNAKRYLKKGKSPSGKALRETKQRGRGPPAAALAESQIPAYPRGVGGLGRRDQNEEPTRPVQPVQDSRAMGR